MAELLEHPESMSSVYDTLIWFKVLSTPVSSTTRAFLCIPKEQTELELYFWQFSMAANRCRFSEQLCRCAKRGQVSRTHTTTDEQKLHECFWCVPADVFPPPFDIKADAWRFGISTGTNRLISLLLLRLLLLLARSSFLPLISHCRPSTKQWLGVMMSFFMTVVIDLNFPIFRWRARYEASTQSFVNKLLWSIFLFVLPSEANSNFTDHRFKCSHV